MRHVLPTIEQLRELAACEWEPGFKNAVPIVAWEQWQRAGASWIILHLCRLCVEGTFPRLALVRVLKRVFRAPVPALSLCSVAGTTYPFTYMVKDTLGALDACENHVAGFGYGNLDGVTFKLWSRGVDARRGGDEAYRMRRLDYREGQRFDGNHQDFVAKYLEAIEQFSIGCAKGDPKKTPLLGTEEFGRAIYAFLDAFGELWMVQNHTLPKAYKRAYMDADLACVIRAAPEVKVFTDTLKGEARHEPAPAEFLSFDFTTPQTIFYDRDGRRVSRDSYGRPLTERVPITALWANELHARQVYSGNVRDDARNAAIMAENERIRRSRPEEPGSGVTVGDREDWERSLRTPTFRFLAEYAHLMDPTSRRQFFDR